MTVLKFAHSTYRKTPPILEVKGEIKVPEPTITYYAETPKFTGRNVPIPEIAAAINKTPELVRYGIRQGVYRFGVALYNEKSNSISYYCSDKKVWEETGYFREEEDNAEI